MESKETTKTVQRSEEKVKGLEKLIDGAHYESWAAMLAGIEIYRHDKKLAEETAEKLRDRFVFLEGKTPGNAASQAGLDLEMDLMPALQWLYFIEELRATRPQTSRKKTCEMEGDPKLRTIKRWLSGRSFSEKLCGILLWQLINKECEFDKPDNEIGNNYFRAWEKEVIDTSGDPEYLQKADSDEAAVASITAAWIPWQV